jgi:hypothetical protein
VRAKTKEKRTMLRNTLLSVLFAGALASGAAGATERTFEIHGTVTYSADTRLARVGSSFVGKMSYDDAEEGFYMNTWYAYYQPQGRFLSAKLDGHTIVADMLTITINDNFGGGNMDFIDVDSGVGLMVDGQFQPEHYFGFRVLGDGNALASRSLPSAWNVDAFSDRYGYVMTDGGNTLLVEYTIDAIVPPAPAPECLKKNGKPFKKCPKPRG